MFVSAVLLVAVAAAAGGASFGARAYAPPSRLLVEGMGVENVIVGRSTAADVLAEYGDKYKLVEHNKYSYEMVYRKLGLSFWYAYADKEKKIFVVEAKYPFKGSTTRGIAIGRSTVEDVFRIYGKADPSTTSSHDYWCFEYPGVEFYIEYEDSDSDWETFLKQYPSRKIKSIDIVEVKKEEETEEAEEPEP